MDDSKYFTGFTCTNCHTEIQATLDMIGEEADCPACGAKLLIPDSRDDDGVVRHGANDNDSDATEAMKSRTIRIELGDI